MSALPEKDPHPTEHLVKDLMFQAKYNLSHSQTDLMAYLVNVSYWALSINGYNPITTNKVLTDLPHLGAKTFEASLKILKELDLIDCNLVQVNEWRGKPTVRGLRLTKKGKTYNGTLTLPCQDEMVKSLKKELKEANKKITILEENEKNREEIIELKELREELEELKKELKQEEKTEVQEVKEVRETVKEEKKSEEPKAIEEPAPIEISLAPEKEKIDDFIEENIKYFGLTSKPICNFVPSYHKETTFYINCFKKLSMVMPNGDVEQLKNPQRVHEFWEWLYANPQRVSNKINFSTVPTLRGLKQRFLKKIIKINGKERTIIDIVAVKKEVKIKVKDKEQEMFILDSETKEEMLFSFERCQKIILEFLRT